MWIDPDLPLSLLGRVLESNRHYADERHWLTADVQYFSNRVWIAAESLLPEIVTDDADARRACESILRLKDAPAFCLNAEQGKEIRRNNQSIELFRFPLAG